MAQVEVVVVPLDYTTPDVVGQSDVVKQEFVNQLNKKHINNNPPSLPWKNYKKVLLYLKRLSGCFCSSYLFLIDQLFA